MDTKKPAREIKVGQVIVVKGVTCPVTSVRKHRRYKGYLAIQYTGPDERAGQLDVKPGDAVTVYESQVAVRIMRDRAMRGVQWTADPQSQALVGRLGTFEITLRVRLWTPTAADVARSYGVDVDVARKRLEERT